MCFLIHWVVQDWRFEIHLYLFIAATSHIGEIISLAWSEFLHSHRNNHVLCFSSRFNLASRFFVVVVFFFFFLSQYLLKVKCKEIDTHNDCNSSMFDVCRRSQCKTAINWQKEHQTARKQKQNIKREDAQSFSVCYTTRSHEVVTWSRTVGGSLHLHVLLKYQYL